MKYRRKSRVFFKAVRFTGEGDCYAPIMDLMGMDLPEGYRPPDKIDSVKVPCVFTGGELLAKPGDWIVKGPVSCYVLSNQLFERDFEKAE